MTIHSGTPLPDNDDDNAMQLASVPARENFPLHHCHGTTPDRIKPHLTATDQVKLPKKYL